MSTRTVTDAKAGQQEKAESGVVATIERYRPDLSIVLPSHVRADTWMRVAISATRKSAELKIACETSPATLMAALYEAARLGLEPGTDQYYLTPRRNKQGNWEVLGIVGYQGEIELIYRSGAVSTVICYDVREGDEFVWRPGVMDRPVHHPRAGDGLAWFSDVRGEVLGAYAYAVMRDGAISNVIIADKTRIDRARKASATAGSSYSPWVTDYRAMVLKTAAHDLTKWTPTSAEYREALRGDARAGTTPPDGVGTQGQRNSTLDQFLSPPGVVDGEIVDHGVGEDTAPADSAQARPDPADPASHPVGRTQMRRLFALLKDRGIESDEARHRFAAHALERDDLESFKQLSASDASRLITQLEALQRNSPAGPEHAPPPEEN